MSWEDEDFTPVLPGAKKNEAKDSWEDEDEGNTIQIKGSWDGEDAAILEPVKPKSEPKKPAAKPPAKKPAVNPGFVPTGDPVVDKLRERQIVEDADYENVQDMFGLSREKQAADEAQQGDVTFEKAPEKPREPALLDSRPKTETEFDNFAAQLAKKLSVHETSPNYSHFVKSLTRNLCTSFTKPEDVMKIVNSLNELHEKLKREKAKPKLPAGKKSAGPTTGKKVYKDAFDDDFDTQGDYDDYEDDFMG